MKMLELRQHTLEANLRIVREGLVTSTFGNASAVDREEGLMAIKASGVPYAKMGVENIVLVDLATGEALGGPWRPSSDTPTHLELYRAFPGIGGIVHTHSLYATGWAQAGLDIPALGTTHADYFNGPVPCTRPLRDGEIASAYEVNTGRVIVERFASLDPAECPAVLVANHGPFTWGPTVALAVEHAVSLEYVARLAALTVRLNPGAATVGEELLRKHFRRKHGPEAYYGQGSAATAKP
jgi:L-ribulose-5-phosphate 4-epimerase